MAAPASKRAPASKAPPSKKPRRKLKLITGGAPAGMPEQPKPFDFQKRAANEIRKFISQGVDVCLASPTGSGKTVIAGLSVQGLAADEVLAVSHSNALCDQLEERLCPQSFTVQGLLAGDRPQKAPKVVIWDECHHSEGDRWRQLRKECFPKAQFTGLTPCPQRSDGRALGLFQELVVAASYSELLDIGLIVPCRVSGPEAIYGDKRPDPVRAYMKGARGKKALLFLPDTETADDTAKALKRNGVAVGAYHCNMPRKERKELFAKFRTGEILAICAVHSLSEGIDVPDAEVGILAQRCEGMSKYINSVGRILRAAPGKREAHLIDLTGASLRHGRPCSDVEYSLYGSGIYRKEDNGGTRSGGHEREALPTYDANLVTWFDVKWPTKRDKEKTSVWLRQQAQQHGYTEEMATQAFTALFGAQGATWKEPAGGA